MKTLRQSKTFWINLLIIAAGAIGGAMGVEGISPQIVGYMAAALGVVNIILRIFSPTAIKGV